MAESTNSYPVNGSSALSVDSYAPAKTHIIDFPAKAKRPLHDDPEQDLFLLDKDRSVLSIVADRFWQGEMMHALRYGTCAGKATGRMSSRQAAAAALGFFVFFMGTLLFV
ncbi:MAG: hypothetical protein U0L71_01575 [Eggerthellaceae bacterium]|nr:hypothetical protein [Eggerthellaceae bacterium]